MTKHTRHVGPWVLLLPVCGGEHTLLLLVQPDAPRHRTALALLLLNGQLPHRTRPVQGNQAAVCIVSIREGWGVVFQQRLIYDTAHTQYEVTVHRAIFEYDGPEYSDHLGRPNFK